MNHIILIEKEGLNGIFFEISNGFKERKYSL